MFQEIQQQRAAQKLMEVFNQVKPDNMPHSPRSDCVCVCVCESFFYVTFSIYNLIYFISV